MKKAVVKSTVWLCAVLFCTLLLSACVKESLSDDRYTLQLAEGPKTVTVGKTITLPEPKAINPAGEDISHTVMVEVLYQDQSVYVPEHRYAFSPDFTPSLVGTYHAVYSVCEEDGQVLAKATYTVRAEKEILAGGIRIDGVLEEEVYSEGYSTGVEGNLSFRYAFCENGLLVGVEVADTQLVYNNYLVSRLTQSDGFAICFDFCGEEDDRLNDSCRKLVVGLNGEVYIYVPSESRSFYELSESMTALLDHAVRLHGTKSAVDGKSATEADTDNGYVFEAFLSYDLLQVEAPSAPIGIAFAHRDITSATSSAASMSGGGNRYFSSVELSEGILPILFDNTQNFVYSTYEDFAFTSLYHKLDATGGITAPSTNARG